MAARTESLEIGAGRFLDVLSGGAESGPALVLHHGTPSEVSVWADWDDLARSRDLRLLSIRARDMPRPRGSPAGRSPMRPSTPSGFCATTACRGS